MARNIDWEAIRAEYEAGSNQSELSRKHGISRTAIQKRIEKEGWTQDVEKILRQRLKIDDVPEDSGFVYVIYFDDTAGKRFYKIGMSKVFGERLKGHQCSTPFEICVACTYFVANMRGEERALHERFRAKRLRGEWFDLSQDDLDHIASRSLLV